MQYRLFVGWAFLTFGIWSDALAEGKSNIAPIAQEICRLPVMVTDSDGKGVEGAVVTPWALRSSQGHGIWIANGPTGSAPTKAITDREGRAVVTYPRFAKLTEQVLTTEVTLSVDHPEFVYVMYEFINIPREATGDHVVKLARGASVKLMPLVAGRPISLSAVFAVWSDGRSWAENNSLQRSPEFGIRIPPMSAGKAQVRLIQLEGDGVTAFSPLLDFDLKDGETFQQRVELHPPSTIRGRLSTNVPRPVENGRIKAQSLAQEPSDGELEWFTWAPIADDGTFEITAWPAGEAVQVTALCDGFIGEQGEKREGLQGHLGDGFVRRPQVFEIAKDDDLEVIVQMTPLAVCEIETVDQQGAPIVGANVSSSPNVHWWNGGTQIYCAPLVRFERVLRERDYYASADDAFPPPFQATTDDAGKAILELPEGTGSIVATHEDFELPIVIGRRQMEVELRSGAVNHILLKMQPKGTELLGEWDKLAGVLFGCTGEQCRRLLSDPEFRNKMEGVRAEFDAALDPTAPTLLHGAYKKMADAFDELDDQEEAEKWRRKAEEQAAKLEKK